MRLYFGSPPGLSAEWPRTFDVLLQGQAVLADVTVTDGELAIREVPEVLIGEQLTIQLVKKSGEPILSGVELRRIETTGGP